MDINLIKCFICAVPCVAVDKFRGSYIAGTMAMPLSSMLAKCLRIMAAFVEDEYFCKKCTNKIEEYDKLVQQSRRIERDLYEQFQTKLIKCDANQTDIITDQNGINQILIEETITMNEDIEADDKNCKLLLEEIDIDVADQVKFEFEQNELKSKKRKSIKQINRKKKTDEKKNIDEKTQGNEENKKMKMTHDSKSSQNVKKKHYKIEQVTCDICGRSYQSKGALGVHIVKHLNKSPHECEICHKTFTQRIGLTRHMPIHTGVQNHQCDVCGKRFIHSASLNMHKKIHVNERPKKCNICGAEFRSSSHIKRHMRSHTGEKPFQCTICGQKFTQGYNLKTHYKIHDADKQRLIEKVKMFNCLICSQKYSRREKLNEHLAAAHQIIDTSTPPNVFGKVA